MFRFIKQLFSKRSNNQTHATASATETETPASKHPEAASGVEVATLSLRAILDKLPADLKSTVNQMPASDVKVVLPVAAIVKQLPGGVVRMSLASLHRQAPNGTFRKTNVEDKRLVDVPLTEVFKTINPGALKRRDQRTYEVPQDAIGLFDENNARNVSVPTGRTGSGSNGSNGSNGSPAPAAPAAPQQPAEKKLRMPEPATPAPAPAQAPEPAAPLKMDGELSLQLVEIAAGWPEGYRNELSVLSGDTRVTIPTSEVGPLLQKGKVAFTWDQITRWLNPPASGKINIPSDTVLTLPLKIVAPAFVAATGAKKRNSQLDSSIPDFFGPTAGQVPTPKPAAPAAPAPAATAPAWTPTPATPPSSKPAPSHAAQPAAAPASSGFSAPAQTREPITLRELFNMPEKTDWPPNELVKLTCAMSGVAGVVVALEEGLVVAQRLPDGFAADTFAAFMPQVFSRMDKYTGEMQLGETNDITLNTESGAIRMFRNGKVFFAALGKQGETLPIGLHLICNELASQNS